ncbi:MAG TPA: ABC transporter substrate binding protein, partial [Candidatus Binatia bacterium]|nr:ABC transporter substrate binding protein [Candidatus Binatia bacterium]
TFATCGAVAQAQQPTKVARIGFLAAVSPSAIAARTEAFRQGLRELEYVEGKNIVIERRYAEGKPERMRELAAELVRLKVDVIVTAGPASTRLAKEATVTIPIVMSFDDDPVGSGFAASLARPGANVTGLSTLTPEISGRAPSSTLSENRLQTSRQRTASRRYTRFQNMWMRAVL